MATTPTTVPVVEKPTKSKTPVLKTKVLDTANNQTKTPENSKNQEIHKKTITRKNVTPSAMPTKQADKAPVTTAISKPSAEQPKASSVPRRKKPKMPKQAPSAQVKVTAPVAEVVKEIETAPNMLPPPISEGKPLEIKPTSNKSQKSSGLKINPYPKNTGKQASGNPVVLKNEDPQGAGERALQGVYSGDKEVIEWNDGDAKFSVVEGFGTDMPLALALGQIVPPSYAYSFGEGVNPGQKVSWSGGKPWNEVLSETLAPLGIAFELDGQKIVMMKADEASSTQNTLITDDQLKKKQN